MSYHLSIIMLCGWLGRGVCVAGAGLSCCRLYQNRNTVMSLGKSPHMQTHTQLPVALGNERVVKNTTGGNSHPG